MTNKLNVKPVINKNNGQINISLPKRQLPKEMLKDFDKIKNLRISLEGWDW